MSETANLPCVYGEQILKDCPVQIFLLLPKIEKYQRAADPEVERAKLIGEAIRAANNMTFVSLAAFCNSCPYLHHFKSQREAKK